MEITCQSREQAASPDGAARGLDFHLSEYSRNYRLAAYLVFPGNPSAGARRCLGVGDGGDPEPGVN